MPVPPHHFDDEPADPQPGGLLGELERRQDDVLEQLDDLDAKLSEVLRGLEPSPVDGSDQNQDEGPFEGLQSFDLDNTRRQVAPAEIDASEFADDDDFESAEDWA
ncbi:MAG: hypothetical protein KDB00_29500 [Planctomycetales bacterium]|nr:hypothetical protein [Planctomycetales bacterium]